MVYLRQVVLMQLGEWCSYNLGTSVLGTVTVETKVSTPCLIRSHY